MQVYSTESIRNVVLLSHSGAGKTSLVEAMLIGTGAINRLGRVQDGNTVSDFEPEEIERGSSVQMALAPCEWQDVKINVLDTPGYADFAGEVWSALAAADCAMVLVSAVDGVEVGTELSWQYADRLGLPRIVVVSKMDRENADFFRTLAGIEARLGKKCVALQLPQGVESQFQGVIDLLSPDPAGMDPQAAALRERLVEAAAESDEALTEKYLEDGGLSPAEVAEGLKRGIAAGAIVPILACSAAQQKGVAELMDVLAQYGPSPLDRPPRRGSTPSGESIELAIGKGGPLAVQVFKTSADPYVGKLSYLRVLSDTLHSDSQVWNSSKGQVERIGQLFVPRGRVQEGAPTLSPGDIGAVAKLQHTATGDTLCRRDAPVVLPAIEFPASVYSMAISPKTKADMDKMGSALARLVDEDPSLRFRREQDSGETVLSGLGEAHTDVAAKKLKRKFGVEVLLTLPQVPYRETIRVKTQVEYKHKKQTGGHGQYGHVFLELEPLPRGEGVQYGERVVGGSVPKEYFPAVHKGVLEAVQQGVLAGSQVVDVKVTLYDGSFHHVDSSGIAFQIAASHAMKKGMQEGDPLILEPIMLLRVTAPDSSTGDIMGDLNGKRARVLGTTLQDGFTTIEAQVPMAEVQRYATGLRSLTQGRGYYAMEFSHYEELPGPQAQKAIEEARRA